MSVWSGLVGAVKFIAGTVVDTVNKTLSGMEGALEAAGNRWDNYEDSLAKLARSAGMSAEQFKKMQVELNAVNLSMDAAGKTMAMRFGYGAETMAKWTQELQSNIGRNVTWTQEQYESYAALMRYTDEAGSGILTAFQNLGVDAVQTQERLSKVLNQTMKTGVNFGKTLKNATESASALNTLTFRNGINGFTEMAKQAASMNFSMQQTLKVAEKIQDGDFNNLAEMSSKLQVLGGQFAQFANPLEMLYEGTSDVGALQDRIIKMFSGAGKFNDQTGQVELGRFEKIQVQQAANALGIDRDEVFKMINTAAIKDKVDSQIANKFTGDDRELIKNTASISGGKAVVRIGTETKDVSALTKQDLEILRGLKETDRDTSIIQIAQDVRSIREFEDASKVQDGEFKNQFYQNDMLAGLGEMAQTIGAIGGSAASLIGGGIGQDIQGLISKFNGMITGKNADLSGLSTLANQISSQIKGNLGGLSGEQRREAESIAQTIADAGKALSDGKTSLKDVRQIKATINANTAVSKLSTIIDILEGFKRGFDGTRNAEKDEEAKWMAMAKKYKGVLSSEGGLRYVPYATGGSMLDGIKEGGYLKDIFPAGTPFREETPFATLSEEAHASGGNTIVETAQPAEYIVRESAVNTYGVSALDSVNNGSATIIPHNVGGAIVKPYASGGEIVAPTIAETHNSDYSYNNTRTLHEGTVMLKFANGGVSNLDQRKLDEILNAIKSQDIISTYTKR